MNASQFLATLLLLSVTLFCMQNVNDSYQRFNPSISDSELKLVLMKKNERPLGPLVFILLNANFVSA
jgi:hypothetical protein